MLKHAAPMMAAIFALSAMAAKADGLALTGPDGKSAHVSLSEIAALPHVGITVTQHGKTRTFEGVPLARLLMKVGAPFGKEIRGGELTNIVLVTARDGYQVALALAELDANTQKGQVIVADRMDGAILPEKNGPLQLVVESDLRPARSARMIEAVEVRRLSTTTKTEAAHAH